MLPMIDWESMCISVKTWWIYLKTKMSFSIFLAALFLYSNTVKARCTFLLASICFFILWHYFQIERIVWQEFENVFYYFPLIEYTPDGTLDALFFSFFCWCCCYILVVLTGHLFENPNLFYFVKKWSMLRVSQL